MSVLDCGDGLVFTSKPEPDACDPSSPSVWDSMTANGPYKIARLMHCGVNDDCRMCRKAASLSIKCPLCGSVFGGTNRSYVGVCSCGATLVSCVTSPMRAVVCGICIPIAITTEDVI